MFLTRLEPAVARFGPPRMPKCPKNGQRNMDSGFRQGSVFLKLMLGHLGCTNK